jgi:hypothetical protein
VFSRKYCTQKQRCPLILTSFQYQMTRQRCSTFRSTRQMWIVPIHFLIISSEKTSSARLYNSIHTLIILSLLQEQNLYATLIPSIICLVPPSFVVLCSTEHTIYIWNLHAIVFVFTLETFVVFRSRPQSILSVNDSYFFLLPKNFRYAWTKSFKNYHTLVLVC